jgi:alkylated DNA nucleotide flippase Atl1
MHSCEVSDTAFRSLKETQRNPTLPEQQVEPEVTSGKDLKSLELALQVLWDKARMVSESLVHLKEANAVLRRRVAELEGNEQRLKEELLGRERELDRLRQEALRLQSNGSESMTKEEKEALKARIKDLIAKINSHL